MEISTAGFYERGTKLSVEFSFPGDSIAISLIAFLV